VFLTAEHAGWAAIERDIAYLNPADDTDAGFPSLLGRSLRTTRRPDALKVAVTLRALGRTGLGALVDRCHDLARYAADAVVRSPRLELRAVPVLSTVVFRYLPEDPRRSDEINAELRRRLLIDGRAVLGRADLESGGSTVHLKLTLLNPSATAGDVEALLALVVDTGRAVEARP
jgi:L-2,4-diaminobutyrate decarboxylase